MVQFTTQKNLWQGPDPFSPLSPFGFIAKHCLVGVVLWVLRTVLIVVGTCWDLIIFAWPRILRKWACGTRTSIAASLSAGVWKHDDCCRSPSENIRYSIDV